MRLIDADVLNRKKKYSFQVIGGCFPKSEWFIKLEDLHRAPTVDAVPVIRCRECKKSSYDKEFGKRWCNRDSVCVLVTDDDFCSRCDRG